MRNHLVGFVWQETKKKAGESWDMVEKESQVREREREGERGSRLAKVVACGPWLTCAGACVVWWVGGLVVTACRAAGEGEDGGEDGRQRTDGQGEATAMATSHPLLFIG